MAEELGQNFKLYVGLGTGSPETFTVVAGQKGLTREVATALIDVSSKTSGTYGQQVPGRGTLTINVTGQRVLPDANGLERVYALAQSRTAANFRIVNTLPSPTKIPFQCSMYVANFSQQDDDQQGGTYSFQLTVASTAPTVDDLTP